MIEQLKQLLGEANIADTSDQRERYAVAGRVPELVFFPTNAEQIAGLLKLANRAHKKVLVCGNNSQRCSGAPIEPFDWCISLERMTRIVDHAAADLIATVEAGIRLATLQQFLNQQRQFLPIDPFDAPLRTVGGIVSSNSTGPLRLRYGSIRDLVLGMTVMLADGTIIRAGGKTVKNVAGYDLSKMFIGSMGTLGIMTSITFRLSPFPSHSQTGWFEFDQLDSLAKLLREFAGSNLVIGRCEFLNAKFIEHFNLKSIRCRAPQGLLINVHGPIELVESTMAKVHHLASSFRGRAIQNWQGHEETQLWEQIGSCGSKNGERNFGAHYQIAVPKSFVIALIDGVQQFGKEHGASFPISAHAGNGIIHLFDLEVDGTRLRSHIVSLRQMAQAYQGNLIVNCLTNRSDGPMDFPPDLIWGVPGADFSIMKGIKAKYDPAGIFAAGRFIGGL